ncbi:hypothetical protein [Noviherbaspirillum denitrificans]|uniref:Uncharacterized protein n=1 Tax=Noviherbaspirillum denitrificans TaxID=1968433 RepID=A0A254TC29_9BURK|nr:hypothetical protein [Noviherbaspirillum denitrificans]OWW20209.1 hypothetical protein AYR66_12595 [Noviherbaspirillum denitrificans]
MPLPELVSDDDAPLVGELLPLPEELLPLVPEAPEEPDALLGVSTVVVVVVTAPDDPLLLDGLAPDVAAPDLVGSEVVVVVVVCAYVSDAVPISDRKIAIGNFFMLAPLLVGYVIRLAFVDRFAVFHRRKPGAVTCRRGEAGVT